MAVDHTSGNVSGLWRSFFVSISLIILVFVLGVFLGMFFQNKDLIEEELLTRARSHFDNIVLTRAWNARYGGVYVEKTTGVESNPYLKNPDITASDGRVYTKKNPALMTREISEMAARRGDYRFHITSLNLLNPDNKPDRFEEDALMAFERDGVEEVFAKEEIGGAIPFSATWAPLPPPRPAWNATPNRAMRWVTCAAASVCGSTSTMWKRPLTVNGIITATLFVLTVATMLASIYLIVYKLDTAENLFISVDL